MKEFIRKIAQQYDMKKILIPTDFSDNAKDALEYTLKLIGTSEAKIYILNVVESVNYFPSVADVQVNTTRYKILVQQDKIDALQLYANQYCKERNLNISIITDSKVGYPAQTIIEEAERFGADMIVLGTQGKGYLRTRKIGSISMELMNKSTIPVLMIPQGFKFEGLDNILYASSISSSDPFILWQACRLLNPHSVIVRCLHVCNDNKRINKNLKLIKDYMVSNPASLQTHFYIEEESNIDSNIIEYSDLYSIDLIVMKKSEKSFWRKLFFGSNVNAVHKQITKPLMVLNNEK